MGKTTLIATKPENNSLKEFLNEWGKYEYLENCIYLYDNKHLSDEKLISTLKTYHIKIQLDLFT